MRVAITYHYSLSFGGSERVLETVAGMYPEADFFCLFVDQRFVPATMQARKITTSFLDRIPGARRFYRHLLPLYPLAVECLDLSGYDLVISADGAATKGVLTDQGALHICYCHSPQRSIWDQYPAYRSQMRMFSRSLFAPASQYMRLWDFAAAQRIDSFVANSRYVADRIRKYYRRPSVVIPPPVDTSFGYLATGNENFYLSVGRLVATKRVDLIVLACNALGRELRIIGTGPEEQRLRAIAGPAVRFMGRLPDDQMHANYGACRALLFAADEDFGIVPLEAQSFGRPVIAYGAGGSLETVVPLTEANRDNGVATGIFFPHQRAESLQRAILQFEERSSAFDPSVIQRHAAAFDTQVFVQRFREFVNSEIERHAVRLL